MTGTTVEVTDIRSYANIIGNDALAPVAQKNLEEVGGFTMNDTEKAFALEMQKTLSIDTMPSLDETHSVEPLRPVDLNAPSASTDVAMSAGLCRPSDSPRRPSCPASRRTPGRPRPRPA